MKIVYGNTERLGGQEHCPDHGLPITTSDGHCLDCYDINGLKVSPVDPLVCLSSELTAANKEIERFPKLLRKEQEAVTKVAMAKVEKLEEFIEYVRDGMHLVVSPELRMIAGQVLEGDYSWTREGGFGRGAYRESTTLSWQPTCNCWPRLQIELGDPSSLIKPCLVLDPCAGSGTVGVVCLRLGRSFVGLDLKPDYNNMAYRRIHNSGSLFA